MSDDLVRRIREALEKRVEYSCSFKNASVLVPLSINSKRELHVTFIKRSSKLSLHGGDVAFPGGLREGNEDPIETALREAWEELGIRREDVRVLGFLTPTVTRITMIHIVPVVGLIPMPYPFRPNENEVTEVIQISISDLYRNQFENWYGKYYKCGDHIIWGASARILTNLLERLKPIIMPRASP
ncbi:MAG: NUDIX hydrolase [Candidatus Baldrarchaeia archaeon]